jgi:hypothetical protein
MKHATAKQHKRAMQRADKFERNRHRSKLSPWERERRQRLGELRRLFHDRYNGASLPDDDAGRGDLEELFRVMALAPLPHDKKLAAMVNTASVIAPWLDGQDAKSTAAEFCATEPLYLKSTADNLGKRLRLTFEEREKLDIRTIGAHDVDKVTRAEIRKIKDRLRKNAMRRAKGRAMTRAEYLAQCHTASKPWESEGISRRTWERRRARKACRKSVRNKTLPFMGDTLATSGTGAGPGPQLIGRLMLIKGQQVRWFVTDLKALAVSVHASWPGSGFIRNGASLKGKKR